MCLKAGVFWHRKTMVTKKYGSPGGGVDKDGVGHGGGRWSWLLTAGRMGAGGRPLWPMGLMMPAARCPCAVSVR